jgi:hypothetical protein
MTVWPMEPTFCALKPARLSQAPPMELVKSLGEISGSLSFQGVALPPISFGTHASADWERQCLMHLLLAHSWILGGETGRRRFRVDMRNMARETEGLWRPTPEVVSAQGNALARCEMWFPQLTSGTAPIQLLSSFQSSVARRYCRWAFDSRLEKLLPKWMKWSWLHLDICLSFHKVAALSLFQALSARIAAGHRDWIISRNNLSFLNLPLQSSLLDAVVADLNAYAPFETTYYTLSMPHRKTCTAWVFEIHSRDPADT